MEAKAYPYPKARKYVCKYKLNIDMATKNQLKKWIYKYKEFRGKLTKLIEENDIRQFFIINRNG